MRALLDECFTAAVAGALPANNLAQFLPERTARRGFVVGAGKAAASMAQALVAAWPGELTGMVVTRYGHGIGQSRVGNIAIREAAHPVPDAAGLEAGRRVLSIARQLGADDTLIVLLSGGASALLEVPLAGLTLEHLQMVSAELLAAGADISSINCVRRKLSAIKGGRLAAAAAPARIIVLAISDVPGDCFADIGSGPCSPDGSTSADAIAILERYGCDVPPAVDSVLHDPDCVSPASDDPVFAKVSAHLIATSADALTAAGRVVSAAGFAPVYLGSDINEPACELALRHAQLARDYCRDRRRCESVALISGGETTVAVANPDGRGGRNSEYLLQLALALEEADGIWALAADTDGIDGTEDNAGAIIGPNSLERGRAAGLDASALLNANRSYDFFAALGDLVVTGPTLTNVNDLRVIVIAEPGRETKQAARL